MSRIAVRLIIRGRVQGVGYRWWARTQARRLQLDGWVRNLRDGAVELVAAGPSTAVEQLVDACRHGPPPAEVETIERHEADGDELRGFEERLTV